MWMKNKMQLNHFQLLIILTGCLIFFTSLLLDFFHRGSPNIGFEQISGMVIGIFIIQIGLRRLLLPDESKWDWGIFGFYLSGLLFVGLRPSDASIPNHALLLGMNTLSMRDSVVNIGGFIPLGFLSMAALTHNKGHKKTLVYFTITSTLGLTASLMIETLQYFWVPGRYSSTYDLITNVTGTIIGAICYLIYSRYSFTYHDG